MTQHLNASLATVTVGGRTYPYVTAKGCLVCNSPAEVRLMAEEQTVAGRNWVKIAEALPEGCGLTARNVKDHYANGHIPVHEAAVQEHLDRASKQRGESVAPAAARLADHLDLAQAVLGRVHDRLQAGEVEPTVREALMAGEHLARYSGQAADAADEADYVEAFMIYHETAQKHMSPESLAAFGRDLVSNPVLKALAAEQKARNLTAAQSES